MGIVVILLLCALLAGGIAWSRGFFELPSTKETSPPYPIKFIQVIAAFLIYLLSYILISPILKKTYQLSFHQTPSTSMLGWVHLMTTGLATIFLLLYCRSQENLLSKIWKDPARKTAASQDIILGVLTWFISFPLVTAIGEALDLFLFTFYGFKQYEQLAVRYLKAALSNPSLLTVALITILVAAPIVEELLFRGLLQTYFKRHLGAKAAILLSSLSFALFHLSVSQGLGNISVGISLFFFACFLGFLYERQGSLLAAISLHATFNTINALRILFLAESGQ